jgi:hypothetical protein
LVGPAGGVLGPDLDSVRLVVDVEDALLDFVVDFPDTRRDMLYFKTMIS